MKRLLLPQLAAAVTWFAPAGLAVDWATLKPEGYVTDFARVIDRGSRSRLENYCAEVERETGVQLALVTLPSLQGEPVEDVAHAIARAWEVGRKGRNDGILLLLSIGDRRSRLEIGPGLSGVVRDDLAGEILKEMRPALRRGRYGDALAAAADTLGQTVARARNVKLTSRLPLGPAATVWDWLPWPLLAGGVLILIWLMRAGHPRGYSGWSGAGFLPGLLMGSVLSRSTWGSRGSGGFGGYDSADSFGGFGGGDFGGGGASCDW